MAINYGVRRQALARLLPINSVAIIPAATECIRNGDAHYRFRQDSDFYYLTGFDEPDAVLLVVAGEPAHSVLFNRPRAPQEEQWTGPRLGQDNACAVLGVDEAVELSLFETRLPSYLVGKQAIYYPVGRHPAYEAIMFRAWQAVKAQGRRGALSPSCVTDLASILGEMRVIKSEDEIILMREAARISVLAHVRAMRACRGLKAEHELEAEILYALVREGCRDLAYDSIVASGEHACVLHYTANNKPLDSNGLVLIDAGGEFDHYAADITRTFPVSGRFEKHQRLIYALVLRAQQAGIACVKPGCPWDLIQQTIVRVLTEGLVELGILAGKADDLIKQEAYKPFYMHSSGHWLGLDVHDVGSYRMGNGAWRTLEPGMVLTVEPGLYISKTMEQVDPVWRGIGVRIEDDILVTATGHENLTQDLPVEIDAIEDLLRA